MTKKEQAENQQLKVTVRRLELMTNNLLQRVMLLERQVRTLKAKAHNTGMSISALDRRTSKG